MKTRSILFSLIVLAITSCSQDADLRYRFENIIDISLSPVERTRHTGTFTDAGSWMGFTLPEEDKWISGFCGPFSINEREWLVQSAVTARYAEDTGSIVPVSATYYPGIVEMEYSSNTGTIVQSMVFVDHATALLKVCSGSKAPLTFEGRATTGVPCRHPISVGVQLTC